MSLDATTGAEAPSAQKVSSGSSFHLAMRILEPPRRKAMFEIYAFCRAVDDIADTEGPQEPRRQGLQRWRDDIAELYAGRPRGRLKDLHASVQEFGMRQEDFLAVIDGMEMDVVEQIRAPAFDKLDLYCDRVASAVGRLSVRAFGLPEPKGAELAHYLGRALQMTNIMRDLDEDAAIGRLYLPAQFLQGAGITSTEPLSVVADPRLDAACAPLIAKAQEHFARSDAIMAAAPRRSVRAPRLMAAAYQPLLARMAKRGLAPPRQRLRVNKLRLLGAWLRYAAI